MVTCVSCFSAVLQKQVSACFEWLEGNLHIIIIVFHLSPKPRGATHIMSGGFVTTRDTGRACKTLLKAEGLGISISPEGFSEF